MDLADIRKKAKARAVNGTEPSVPAAKAASRATASIQGAPAEPETASAVVAKAVPTPSPMPEIDPLDALFSCCPDENLATEENYLQTLRSGGEEESEAVCEWLSFTLGSEEYALDIAGVNEIIKLREVTDIPRVPDFILGIISLRGIIVPVYDLQRRLKLGVSELTAASRIIVCQHSERAVGLLVDTITQVVRLPVSQVEPPPAVFSGFDRDLLEGVGRIQGRMLVLLNLANVLNVEII